MKKITMLMAASAMALGVYSCSNGGANLKDASDSVSYAVGFGNATELTNALKGAEAQGQKVDSALFFKGFEEASIAIRPSSGTISVRCRVCRLLCASRMTLH